MYKEQHLIEQLQNGNKQVLSALYDKYSGAIYGVILRICKNEALAQDLLQETFLKIWQNAKKYNAEKGKFYTWAYRIARNCTLNELRKPSKLIQTEDLGVYRNTTSELENGLDLTKLNGAVKRLDVHHQKALNLVYFQGLTHREAHEEMGVPLGTFKSYVQQALKKLRSYYQITTMLIWLLIEKIV